MGRSPEELAEVQRVHEVLSKAMDREIWQIAELMVGKRDDQLSGETEFVLRDKVLRMGAQALEATVNDRKRRPERPDNEDLSPSCGDRRTDDQQSRQDRGAGVHGLA